MSIVFFKKGYKNILLSIILAAILLFPLLSLIPAKLTEATMVTKYANPRTVSTQENATSSIGLTNTSINSPIYSNATQILNQENNSATQMIIGQNNTVSFKLHDSNQVIFSSNVTAAANIASSSNAVAQGASKVTADFNGDGFEDKAVGAPSEDIGILSDVGAVNVIYGSPSGLSAIAVLPDQLWTQNSTGIEGVAETGDAFGLSLSSGDYNGDGKDDLAVGVFEGIGPMRGVGAVNVIYGSAGGLSATAVPAQLWTQDSTGIVGDSEGNDYFGFSLSSGDYNEDGKDDLAIGVLLEDIGILDDVGAVNVIYGSVSGLSAHILSANTVVSSQLWTQNSTGMEDDIETGDVFGWSLSSGDYNGDGKSELAIGVPGEDFNIAGLGADVGAVNVIYGSGTGLSATAVTPAQLWTQNSTGIEGVAEGEDYFGLSLSSHNYNGDNSSNHDIDDLVVGVPAEDIDTNSDGIDDITNAGAVNVIYGSGTGLSATAVTPAQLWTQNSTGMEGDAKADDWFGWSLSSADYNADGNGDVAVGVPREDFNIAGLGADVGAVNVIYGSATGLSATAVTPAQLWTQNSTGIQGIAEMGDGFGWSLSSGDYNGDGKDDLAIGVPTEDVDLEVATLENFDNSINSDSIGAEVGVVQVIYGSGNGLSATAVLLDQVLRQGFANIEDVSEGGDSFGYSS